MINPIDSIRAQLFCEREANRLTDVAAALDAVCTLLIE
jgi:hypothetical protein